MLSNTATGEQIRLPSGSWEIMYGEEGFAAVIATDGQDAGSVRMVDELLTQEVFRHEESGELFVRSGVGRASETSSLWAAWARYDGGSVVFQLPDAGAQCTFDVYVFAYARGCQQRIYWSLKEFYGYLKLTTFKGVCSRWVGVISAKICDITKQLTGGGQVAFGNHGNMGSGKLNALPFSDRSLPATSCSTMALLLMLQRWAFASREKGGLSTDGPKRAASVLFESLLDLALCGEEMVCLIFLCNKWVSRWPRPPDYGLIDIRVHVSEEKCVDLEDLVAQAVGVGRSKVAAGWVKALRACCLDLSAPISLVALFRNAVGLAPLQPLLTQLTMEIAIRVEARLMEYGSAKRKANSFTEGFAFRWLEPSEVMVLQLELKLAQYMLSCVQESTRLWARRPCLTIATDKASVCGLPIQNVFMTFPSGVAIVGVPQAAPDLVSGGIPGTGVWPSPEFCGWAGVVGKNPVSRQENFTHHPRGVHRDSLLSGGGGRQAPVG